MILGRELKPYSPPIFHICVRYAFGEATPKSASVATVPANSANIRHIITQNHFHFFEMNILTFSQHCVLFLRFYPRIFGFSSAA